jgi:hypothetical protein
MPEFHLDSVERAALAYIVRQLEGGRTHLAIDAFLPFLKSLEAGDRLVLILKYFEDLGILTPEIPHGGNRHPLVGLIIPAYWRIEGKAVSLHRDLSGPNKVEACNSDMEVCLHHPPKPAWDKLKRELTYETHRLRKYQDVAEAQIKVLDTFQELDWANVADSPFPASTKGKSQLKNTIKNLNKGLEPGGVIEFYADGSGAHVCWRKL